jgi:hypothetical protein
MSKSFPCQCRRCTTDSETDECGEFPGNGRGLLYTFNPQVGRTFADELISLSQSLHHMSVTVASSLIDVGALCHRRLGSRDPVIVILSHELY